jgi:hypothetical protein
MRIEASFTPYFQTSQGQKLHWIRWAHIHE